MKDAGAEWCSLVETSIAILATDHDITIRRSSTRSDSATTMSVYRDAVAILYIDAFVSNINSRFSDSAVNLLVSSSIFNPVSFPTDEAALPELGNNELKVLLNFYGKEAQAEFGGKTSTSPPLVDSQEILSEWRVFKTAFAKQNKALMKKNQLSRPPILQAIKMEMESCDGHADIFPEIIKLLNILLVLPVGTASVERSFSQMKLVKTRLRSRINDRNLARLMRIATEEPELVHVDFNSGHLRHRIIEYSFNFLLAISSCCYTSYFFQNFWGGGTQGPLPPPLLYETLLALALD